MVNASSTQDASPPSSSDLPADSSSAALVFDVNAVPVSSGGAGTAPAVLVNVCPQYTRKDWEWVAMTTAFGEPTARDIRDKKAWFVGEGASFRANKRIIHAVYDYYGAVNKRNPSKCLWAGLGRVAGGPFFWGFEFIDNWIQSIEADPCFAPPDTWIKALVCSASSAGSGVPYNSGVPNPDVQRGMNVIIHSELQSAIEALMKMGRDIFIDLAWQHEAYLAGGLTEILRLNQPTVFDRAPELQKDCINAWTNIDGDSAGALRGNCALFQREQLQTIPPGYKDLHALLGVPTVMSFLAHSPHPWGKSFFDYWQMTGVTAPPWGGDPKTALPQGQNVVTAVFSHDVTEDGDRWSWMQNNVYPTWMSVSDDKRKTMVGLSLEDLCARRWPPDL
jgi:hypothetical protein